MATFNLKKGYDLNLEGKPQKVDNIIPESDDEKRRYNEGKERHMQRLERLKGRK